MQPRRRDLHAKSAPDTLVYFQNLQVMATLVLISFWHFIAFKSSVSVKVLALEIERGDVLTQANFRLFLVLL